MMVFTRRYEKNYYNSPTKRIPRSSASSFFFFIFSLDFISKLNADMRRASIKVSYIKWIGRFFLLRWLISFVYSVISGISIEGDVHRNEIETSHVQSRWLLPMKITFVDSARNWNEYKWMKIDEYEDSSALPFESLQFFFCFSRSEIICSLAWTSNHVGGKQ